MSSSWKTATRTHPIRGGFYPSALPVKGEPMCRVPDDCIDMKRGFLFAVRRFFRSVIDHYSRSGRGVFTNDCENVPLIRYALYLCRQSVTDINAVLSTQIRMSRALASHVFMSSEVNTAIGRNPLTQAYTPTFRSG